MNIFIFGPENALTLEGHWVFSLQDTAEWNTAHPPQSNSVSFSSDRGQQSGKVPAEYD